MSNQEKIDVFFHNLTQKIADTFFKDKLNETKINEEKYLYSINIEAIDIVNSLKSKSKELVELLAKNLEINDVRSLKYHFDNKIQSTEFLNDLKHSIKSFNTKGELNKEVFMNNTIEFIKYSFSKNSFKSKLLNLKEHDNFYEWVYHKKDTILCGYSLVIFILTFSFYVFIN